MVNQHSHTHDDYTNINAETRDLLILASVATPREIAIYEQYKHFVNTYDMDGNTITASRLMRWAQDPKRELYCIFCGKPPIVEQNGFKWCRICDTYKGIMPNCNP